MDVHGSAKHLSNEWLICMLHCGLVVWLVGEKIFPSFSGKNRSKKKRKEGRMGG